MDAQLSSSSEVSRLLCLPRAEEQALESIQEASKNGIFIGNSRVYARPFFLNFDLLINPHIFITGMTGSGKTYLARSMMLKLQAILECIVFVIDFTGEYAEFAELFSFVGYTVDDIDGIFEDDRSRVAYINLKKLKEAEKVEYAVQILEKVTRGMRARGTGSGRRVFLILDEAWKLLEKSRPLEVIVREGRKYRVGIIIASQLIGDLDVQFLGNIATVFVFRVQDKEALTVLQKNYNLRDEQVSSIQNSDLGSCFVIQINRENTRYAFGIKRVVGVEVGAFLVILIGDEMGIEVSQQDFERMVLGLCKGDGARDTLGKAKAQGKIRLSWLIGELISKGADRRAVLNALRKLGIRDRDIADGFSSMVSKSVGGNETR